MSVIELAHEHWVGRRRARVLADRLAILLPPRGEVLDVGCGDGAISATLARRRSDLSFEGVDVLVRDAVGIPTKRFDGETLPFADRQFAAVMLVDVLHHTDDPMILLREARRVARESILIKDHLVEGFLAEPTLRFMDRIGNRRHGVVLPYNYWASDRWAAAVEELDVRVEVWDGTLGLYGFPAGLLFERRLHFMARLRPSPDGVSE